MRIPVVVLSAILVSAAAPLFSGGTGDESLGSEELPVKWGFVPPHNDPDFEASMEEYLVPFSLEAGLFIEAELFDSFSALVDALSSSSVHVALLPALTYLVAFQRGVVQPGLVASTDLIIRDDLDLFGDSLPPMRIARFDDLDPSGWLLPRIILARYGISDGTFEIFETESHEATISALAEGDADVGAVPSRLSEVPLELPAGVSVLAVVEGVGGDGIHFLSTMDHAVAAKITESIMARSDSQRLGYLGEILGWQALEIVNDDVFDQYRLILRSVGLDAENLP